jgi:hypothetical protein
MPQKFRNVKIPATLSDTPHKIHTLTLTYYTQLPCDTLCMQTCFSLPSVSLTTATEPRWLVMHDTLLMLPQDHVIRAPSNLHQGGSNGSDHFTPSQYQYNTNNMTRGHSLWKPTTIQTSLVIYILSSAYTFYVLFIEVSMPTTVSHRHYHS